MEAFTIISTQLFQFFLMLAIGYIAARTAVCSEQFLGGLSKLVLNILLPIFIFANATNGNSRAQVLACLPVLLPIIAMYIGLILLSFPLAKLGGVSGDRGRVFRGTMIYGNSGFIGIPLLTSLFPGQGAIYIAMVGLIDQVFLWTYGLHLTTPQRQQTAFRLKNFINPGIAGVLLTLAVLLLDIRVPDLLSTSLLTIGRSSTPLALIYIGGLLYYSNWQPIIRQKELYIGMLCKMILFPLAFYFIGSLVFPQPDMVRSVAIISGLPTMVAIAMLAQAHDNNGEYALGLVLINTIASLITLTIVAWVIF